ncbi:MAG: DUF2786 domain-containing protein [Alphaproteobacteria bacterium]|nr:DUF2786 domain-containing protein [Alphaproteobacteria bacterium]
MDDKLIARIQALRAKTIANGCTEGEALAAAAKVAELLDRHDLSLGDVEMRAEPCRQLAFESPLKKRIPLDDCIGAVADFCNCRVWREKTPAGGTRHVFFGLGTDIEAAAALAALIDAAVRSELGCYKTTTEYRQFRHRDRDLANKSFMLGMVSSIADKLMAMKAQRDEAKRGTGRELILLKTAVVDAALDKLGLTMREVPGVRRMIAPEAYDAGDAAGASLAIDPALTPRARRSR